MLSPTEIKAALQDMKIPPVAKKIGINQNTLYRLMNDGAVSSKTLEKISDYLEGKNKNE